MTISISAADLASLNAGAAVPMQGPAPKPNPLTITNFTPATGGVGTAFTINGTGFTGATAVKIGPLQFAPTKIVSDSQIVATVPTGAVTGNIAVGVGFAWAFDNSLFTVTATPAPVPVPPVPVTGKPSTAVPTRTITPLAPPAGMKFITIKGNQFVDQNGTEIVPFGCNLTGLENTAAQGWDGSNYWGDSGFPGMPPAALIKSWGFNTVRIPYNTASWLSLICVDGEGTKVINTDPAGIYTTVLDQAVTAYTEAGLYILIEQHWSAPWLKSIPNYPNGAFLAAEGQGAFSDASTSPFAFAEIAKRYSLFTNVMLGCFNEPFLDSFGPTVPADIGQAQTQGGTCARFVNNTDAGADYTINETWAVEGFQGMINAARGAGFKGPISVSDRSYAQDLSAWLTNKPTDPLNCLFADWHAYPTFGAKWGTPAYAYANYGAPGSVSPTTGIKGTCYDWALAIKTAGYPVMITEYGDQNSPGTVGAPFATPLLTWAEANKVGTIAWAFCVTQSTSNNLLKDTSGTPCDGYGVAVKNWGAKAAV